MVRHGLRCEDRAFGGIRPLAGESSLNVMTLSRRVALTALAATLAVLPLHAQTERSASTSGQFLIFGGNAKSRLGLARRADQIRKALLEATGLPGDFETPILINLTKHSGRKPPPPRTALFLGDGNTLKLQINAPEQAVGGTDLEVEIVRALFLEFAYRTVRPKAGSSYTGPPTWLVEGGWQEVSVRTGGSFPGLFEVLIASGPPPAFESFVRMRPESMDPTSRALYRAQAMGLLRALLNSENGRTHFAEFLSGLHATRQDDPRAVLDAFPELAKDPAQLSKLWTLAIARASARDRVEPLSAKETQTRLGAILSTIRIPEGVKVREDTPMEGPAAMPWLSRSESGRFILRRISEDLLRLEVQAHPLYRPIIEEYRSISAALANKKRRGAEKRIAAAGELFVALNERIAAVADYLNWFEATQMDTPSEAFSELPGENPLAAVPPRRDPISVALDSAEARRER